MCSGLDGIPTVRDKKGAILLFWVFNPFWQKRLVTRRFFTSELYGSRLCVTPNRKVVVHFLLMPFFHVESNLLIILKIKTLLILVYIQSTE